MKKILSHFKPSKQDLFSTVSTVLAIFLLHFFKMPVDFLFLGLVALFTIAMDQVYKVCK